MGAPAVGCASPGSSKSPLVSEAKKEGAASGVGEGASDGVSVAAAGSGAVRAKDRSSAWSSAEAPLAGRNMMRSCALRAPSGARILPVETARNESPAPVSSSESAVDS